MQITIDALKSTYDRQGKPYWVIRQKGRILENNLTLEEIGESWELLTTALNDFGPGVYSVELRSSPTSSKNNPTFDVIFGDVPQENQQRGGDRHGIGSAGSFAQVGYIQQWQIGRIGEMESENKRLREDLERERRKHQETQFQKKLDDLRAELAPQPDNFDRLAGLLEIPAVANVVQALAGVNAPAVGTLRAKPGQQVPATTTNQPTSQQPETDDDDQLNDPNFFSLDLAVATLMEFREIYPEKNVHVILNSLLDKVRGNPSLINYLL